MFDPFVAYLLVGLILALIVLLRSKSLQESTHPWATGCALGVFVLLWFPVVLIAMGISLRQAIEEEKDKRDG